jgi:hypothetical protein
MISVSHAAAGAAASMVSPCRCGWSRAAGRAPGVLRPRRRRQYRHGPASYSQAESKCVITNCPWAEYRASTIGYPGRGLDESYMHHPSSFKCA